MFNNYVSRSEYLASQGSKLEVTDDPTTGAQITKQFITISGI